MAGKLILLLGLGAAALVLGSGTAHAESSSPSTGPGPFDPLNPPPDVLKLIQAAATSGNPALMRSTAAQLDKMGYTAQAAALRAAADAIETAQRALPAPGAVSPGVPVVVPGPGGLPIQLPPVVLPGTGASGADPLAAKLTAALNASDPLTNGRFGDAAQKGLVAALQGQEKTKGKYTGAVDGAYGPGTALLVASYNIVPYPPFIWSAVKSKTANLKANFKKAMLNRAAADPTRADEWAHVAAVAQNT
jgi:hypothetical protein